MDTNLLLKEALHLKPTDRLQLIKNLIHSLDKPDKKIDEIWAEESEKRYQAYKKGEVRTTPLNEIIKRYKK
jgi:putative addiction module component (TIGR02574 family)